MQVWQLHEPFAKITSLSELYFRLRTFILMVPTKKVIYMSYDSNTNSYKPWRWVRFDLKFRMKNIYINSNLNPLAKLTNSTRSTEFKDILLRKISQMVTRTIPIWARIVISQAMKYGIRFWIWQKVNGNWDNNIRISQWREIHCRTNTSILRKK